MQKYVKTVVAACLASLLIESMACERSEASYIIGPNATQTVPGHTDAATPKPNKQSPPATPTSSGDISILVNKQNGLSAAYIPNDLVQVKIPFSFAGDSPKKKLRKEAADALERLVVQAAQENIILVGVSGYRSYSTQSAIFAYNAKVEGKAQANRTSAIPGQSEHQTGLAMDVSSPSVHNQLTEALGNKPEGKWLAQNASRFGFIIRYPKDKEAVTGYSYEPWHLRYVGVEIASVIAEKGITLEEYYQTVSTNHKYKL